MMLEMKRNCKNFDQSVVRNININTYIYKANIV